MKRCGQHVLFDKGNGWVARGYCNDHRTWFVFDTAKIWRCQRCGYRLPEWMAPQAVA